MPYRRKQFTREPHKERARRRDERSLTNVVSLRITDDEKKVLDRIGKATSKNVSELFREAMTLWLAKRQKLGLEAG